MFGPFFPNLSIIKIFERLKNGHFWSSKNEREFNLQTVDNPCRLTTIFNMNGINQMMHSYLNGLAGLFAETKRWSN